MPDASADLVAALLASDALVRERLLRAAAGPDLAAAIDTLGHRREPAAAEALSLVADVVDNPALRKAARRQLHRLRSMGVQVPEPTAAVAEPAPSQPAAIVLVGQAWATDIDPTGSRAVWLLSERRLGGAWFAALVLNETRGLMDLSLADTTRKRFSAELDNARRGAGTWITLPGEYALRLVREAVDLTRDAGTSIPAKYRAFRDAFGEASGPPERALVYETISPVEASFNPNWLEESPRLLGEPEAAGWHIAVPPELKARALEVARLPSAALLVPGYSPEQQVMQLLAEAAQQAVTPVVRRGMRRRLEETAYIFSSTERLMAARLAVAAARALEDGRLPAERHPLLRLLLGAGLARLVGNELVGSQRASEVLLDLAERASQASERSEAGGGIETRPSGLILPR